FRECSRPIRIGGAPAKFDPKIAAFRPPQLREPSPQSCNLRLRDRIILRIGHQHADQPHPVRLLRTRGERPDPRAANKRGELAPPHAAPDTWDRTIVTAKTDTLEGAI